MTGYLPSAILKGFMYIIPYAMLGMAYLGGSISKSKEEIKACNMVFYFLMGNVFFLSLISGSLLDEIGEYLTHPRDIPSHLAAAVSAQVKPIRSSSIFQSETEFFLQNTNFSFFPFAFYV